MPKKESFPATKRLGQQAIVIGSSMAGLITAKVLSEYFDRVTILERDQLEDSAEPRQGVPQGRHVHGILTRGHTIMSELFPGLTDGLVEGGASLVDMSKDLAWHHRGLWKRRVDSGVAIYTQTRPFLEWHIRQQLLGCKNVNPISECDVKSFMTDAEKRRVVGVVIHRRNGEAHEEELTGDLVVDASGRGSQTPRWLEDMGYDKPEESVIKVNVGYASRLYRRLPSHQKRWKALMLYPTPPQGNRMGMLFPVEGNRWIVSLIGWVGDHAPVDEEGYLEWARNLEAPDLYNLMLEAEPLTPIVTHKFPSNLRRHYERMRRFPGGLVVIGDAICSFNPSYGQGMTTASLGAITLRRCLDECEGNIDLAAQRFRKKVAKVLRAPWMMAAGEDLSWPAAEGTRPFGTKFMNWYLRKVHELTARDGEILVRFLRVMNMLKPPYTIFHPRILFPVIAHTLVPKRLQYTESSVQGRVVLNNEKK